MDDGFLERFEDVQPAGPDQWNVRCPAHEDRHASLSVKLGPDRWLLHCHAGCGLGDVMISMGLEWRDIFRSEPDPGRGVRRDRRVTIPKMAPAPVESRQRDPEPSMSLPPAPIVASWAAAVTAVADRLHEVKGWTLPTLQALGIGWDGARVTIPIRDAEGRLVTVMRYLPGRRPKMLALGGRGRHLFPPPETFGDWQDLWLVEGEPDAISARELGLRAVSVPGVATWKDEWPERFVDHRMTICMDADGEGRQCAQERARELRSAGVKVAVVDIAPGRVDGFDLGDALAGATREGRLDDLRAYLAKLEREAWR